MTECPFCARATGAGRVAAFDDGFPVSPGHRLVVPTAHVERLEDLPDEDWAAVFARVQVEARAASQTPGVTGVNVGVNSGRSAGQTVPHAHVHVIPRRDADVADPRGGVRWVVPRQADYWSG